MATSIPLLPLLTLYGIVFAATATSSLAGDEPRYAAFAVNLTHGFYSDRNEINLWNGPGYPLILSPIAALQLPWIVAKSLNVVFLFGTICYFYATLQFYLRRQLALRFSYLFGVSPPFMATIHLLYTECFAAFLVSGFTFHFCKGMNSAQFGLRSLFAASACLAWLVLTKVMYGYVLAFLLIVFLLMYLSKRVGGRALAVCILALILCAPYLIYTYSLTGRVFYWANSGGSTIYWMSSPFEGELGDWHGSVGQLRTGVPLSARHQEFFSSLQSLPVLEQDDALRRRGIQQILDHPTKFLLNWAANVGRLLFSYPFSYTPQKLSSYFYIVPNMFVVVLAVLCIYPSFRRRDAIPAEIWILLLFAAVSLTASSLVSAYERQFQILVPVVLLWLFYTLNRVVRISLL